MAAHGGERRRAVVRAAAALATMAAITGCGASDDAPHDAAAAAVAATTTAADKATASTASTASTTSTSTSSSTTTTSSTSTTTTTTIVLPQPIAPPLDDDAAEPVIELGAVEIPAIGVAMTMYEGIRLSTLDYGPGHWPGSAMPGHAGNVVVAGHRTSKHKVFRNLDQLEPGDEIIFDGADGRFVYHVTRTEIVSPDAVWIVDQTPASTATLFACHPPGSTRERIVVFADLAA